MSKKCKVNWSDIDGASPNPKRLHLEKDETDRPAQQIVNRCFKFLKFCCEEEEEITLQSWILACVRQACSNLLTFCKNSANLDMVGDWAT